MLPPELISAPEASLTVPPEKTSSTALAPLMFRLPAVALRIPALVPLETTSTMPPSSSALMPAPPVRVRVPPLISRVAVVSLTLTTLATAAVVALTVTV